MYAEDAAKDTEALVGLICPQCHTSLSVISGFSNLTFHCLRGHAFSVEQLLSTHAVAARESLCALVSAWQQKTVVLGKVADKARRDGYLDVAANFDRESGKIEARLLAVRRAFLADDSKIVLPHDID